MPGVERPRDQSRISRAVASRVLRGGPSKLRGVIWHKSNGKWEARIYEAGKQRFLGYHTSETSAARAYDARAVQLHGCAAKVNFPEEHEATRFNAPAVKPQSGGLARLGAGLSPEYHRRKSPRGSSWASTCTRPSRRREEGEDDDYVQPYRLSEQDFGGGLERKSSRRLSGKRRLAATSIDDSLDSDSETEDSLEQAAVEVLATMFSSSSSCEAGSSALVRQASGGFAARTQSSRWQDRALGRQTSPPTSSTGASPAPAPRLREWSMPLFTGQPGGLGSAIPAPQAVQEPIPAAAEEDGADSYQATSELGLQQLVAPEGPSNGGSCSAGNGEAGTGTVIANGIDRCESVARDPAFSKSNARAMMRQELQLPARLQAKRARYNSDAPLLHQNTAQDSQTALNCSSSLPPRQATLARKGSRASGSQVRITTAAKAAAVSRGRATRGSSRFRGVSWCEKGQKWRALIWDGHRQHFLGHFKSEEDGARAYDRALLTRKKKDGLLNFPLSDYTDVVGRAPDAKAYDFLKPGQANTQGSVPVAAPNVVQRHSTRLGLDATVRGGSATWEHDTKPREDISMRASAAPEPAVDDSPPFKGLSWSPRCGKWRAQMWLGSRAVHLGLFDAEEEASRALSSAAAASHEQPRSLIQGDGSVDEAETLPASAAGVELTFQSQELPQKLEHPRGVPNAEVLSRHLKFEDQFDTRQFPNGFTEGPQGQPEMGSLHDDGLFSGSWGSKRRRNDQLRAH